MANQLKWVVRLGAGEWARHTYERAEDAPLTLLGSVMRGQQIGALAQTAEGQYVQVVGDHVVPLNTSKIAAALARAKAQNKPQNKSRGLYRAASALEPAKPMPVVTIKRRRVFVVPTGEIKGGEG